MRKIEPKDGIEVYVSTSCRVVISQSNHIDGEQLVVIFKEDVPKIIEFLQECYEEALDCEPEDDQDGPQAIPIVRETPI